MHSRIHRFYHSNLLHVIRTQKDNEELWNPDCKILKFKPPANGPRNCRFSGVGGGGGGGGRRSEEAGEGTTTKGQTHETSVMILYKKNRRILYH